MKNTTRIKKRKLSERLAAALLSVVLAAGMISGGVSTQVYAAEPEAENEVQYSADGGVTWTEGDLATALWEGITTHKNNDFQIELLRDITLTTENYRDAAMDMGSGGTTWTIDGKGYTITRKEGVNMLFCIRGGVNDDAESTVIFKNITIDGGAVWEGNDPATRTNSNNSLSGNKQLMDVGKKATLILDSGAVLQNSDLGKNWSGAAVYVGSNSYGGGGTLIINDGALIKDNCGAEGGAIKIASESSKLIMEGGVITGNYSASGGGGAIVNYGTFEMRGGQIDGNVAKTFGGAVSNWTGTFTMSDGSMSGNKAPVGGAVLNHKGDGDNSIFTMSGGSITGNMADNGGGIAAYTGVANIEGGSITNNSASTSIGGGVYHYYGTLNISGNPVITGNTGSDGANNVYINKNKTISVSSALNADAMVGVTTGVKPATDAAVAVTAACDADYSAYFQSDKKEYEIQKGTDNALSLAIHKHWYDTSVWQSDSTGHWHACKCGDRKDVAAHQENQGTVTTEPTATTDGVKTYQCRICGYTTRTEVIDKTGGSTGTVEVGKEQAADAPDTNFGTSKQDIISSVLTKTEQDSIAAGTDIKIILAVDNIDDSVQDTDKQTVKDAAGSFSVGQYLDVNLYKLINGTGKTPILETNNKIRIVITVPDKLRNTSSGKHRTYAVVRLHDGSAQMLPDLDSAEDTVTIETDKFSTYALVYQDTDVTTEPGGGSGTDDANDADNTDNTNDADNTDDTNDADDTDDTNDTDSGQNNGSAGNGGNTNQTAGDAVNNGISSDGDSNSSGPVARDEEPKTGDFAPTEIYATLAMIAGLAYLLDYFDNRKRGMTEQEKQNATAVLIAWGKSGGKLKKLAALAMICILLFYYHSIGKSVDMNWKEVYGR